jgi:hypothetical protein
LRKVAAEVKNVAPSRMRQIVHVDEAAEWIEYGTKNTPPHGTMASARMYLEQVDGDEDTHI